MAAGAATGGTALVRDRLNAQRHVDLGRAVLAAMPVNIGAADAAVVSSIAVSAQSKVRAGQELARVRTAVAATPGRSAVQVLRAPSDATVVSVLGSVGTTLRAGDPLLTLYDPKKLTFHVDVPVDKLRGLRIGMTVSVRGAGTNRTLVTTLDSVLPLVGTATAASPGDLTIVLRPRDPSRVTTLVPGLPFAATADIDTAAHGTPVLDSA
ncbi:MAG: hypothetical protein QOI76_3558 [Frankiales bacterium]|nr:hypothetical protein [Frankiales bacterium]